MYTQPYQIRSSLQPGKYFIKSISVQNEAELKSLEWKNHQSFEVIAGKSPTTSSLNIESLEFSPKLIQGGGTITARFVFRSEIVPLGVNALLTGPLDYLESISIDRFTKQGENTWRMENTIQISEWLPSGTYQLSNLIAYHENVFATYDGKPLIVEVKNAKVADKPVILETILEPEAGKRSAMTTFRVRIRSAAPVNLLTADYETPRTSGATMYGYKITSLGNDEWEAVGGAYIFANSPEGTYNIKNMKVRNEGNIISDAVGPIVFKVEK